MRGGDSIPQLVSAVYDAALDAELWPSVLEQFARSFGSTSAHLSEDNLTSTAGRLLSYGFDPAFSDLYAQYYAARNVLWKCIVHRSLEGVLTDRIIMPRDSFVRSEFYNDFLQPQGAEEILCFAGTPRHDMCVNLVLGREHRHGVWGAKDMKALAMVTPHFDRALGINRQIGDLRIVSDVADETLYHIDCGVILVDPDASVLFANRVAERLLSDGLRTEHMRLAAQRPTDTAALRRMIAETARTGIGQSLVVERANDALLLMLSAPMTARAEVSSRYSNAVILLIRDLDSRGKPELASFARHFGLTPAETALAAELASADGVAAAAERLGISRATVRTHLIHIFQKTGTCRQAELVRLILTWTGPLLRARDRLAHDFDGDLSGKKN